jgi:hypothetical protein
MVAAKLPRLVEFPMSTIANLEQWKRERQERNWQRLCLRRATLWPFTHCKTDCGDPSTWRWL